MGGDRRTRCPTHLDVPAAGELTTNHHITELNNPTSSATTTATDDSNSEPVSDSAMEELSQEIIAPSPSSPLHLSLSKFSPQIFKLPESHQGYRSAMIPMTSQSSSRWNNTCSPSSSGPRVIPLLKLGYGSSAVALLQTPSAIALASLALTRYLCRRLRQFYEETDKCLKVVELLNARLSKHVMTFPKPWSRNNCTLFIPRPRPVSSSTTSRVAIPLTSLSSPF